MSGRTTPEDAFRAAQARLLAATGTRAMSRAVRVHGRWVHVIEAGAGRPVVLVHGGSAGVAASLAQLMSRLQDGFHLFAPDRPGCGLSDAPSYRGVRLREHAGHFLEGLLQALGLERVNLVGSSMGGYWALAFALTHPEQVQRLVVLGAPAGSARQPSLRERLLATPGVGELLPLAGAPGRAGAAGRLAARHVAHPERLTGPLLDAIRAGERLPAARRTALGVVRAGIRPVGPARLTHALRDELEALRLPVLLVWGARDPCPVGWGLDLRDAGRVGDALRCPRASLLRWCWLLGAHVLPFAMKGTWADIRRPPSVLRRAQDAGTRAAGVGEARWVPRARAAGRAGRDNVESLTVQRNLTPAIRATVSDSTYRRPDAAHLPAGRRPDATQSRLHASAGRGSHRAGAPAPGRWVPGQQRLRLSTSPW